MARQVAGKPLTFRGRLDTLSASNSLGLIAMATDSDSVSRGSNPRPPATDFIEKNAPGANQNPGSRQQSRHVAPRSKRPPPRPFRELLPPIDERKFWYSLGLRPKGECWNWLWGKNAQGYGRVKIGGKLYSAHRIAFAIAKGDELVHGAKRLVLHSCDNPSCCNPEHLRLGSYRDNMQDMLSRGRHPAQQGRE